MICEALVSGKKRKRKIKQNPDSHKISQMVHFQPLASTAKPPTMGPMTWPMMAAIPKMLIAYALLLGSYMSTMLAPPVASTGLPKSPDRKRMASNVWKFFAWIIAG